MPSRRKATVTFDNAAAGFAVGKKANNVGGIVKQAQTSTLVCFELAYKGTWYSAKAKVGFTFPSSCHVRPLDILRNQIPVSQEGAWVSAEGNLMALDNLFAANI